MVDVHFNDGDGDFTSDDAGAGFFEAPFLREMLNDLTLALDLGRPVFLLGPAGSGKSALAARAALLLGTRYGVARLAGRRNLGFDDVVEACRTGFQPEVWSRETDGAMPRDRDRARPGDSVMLVDPAEAIPPRFVEQMIAMSNGSPDLLPSHRILLVGRDALVDVIETGRVRNNWGVPLVLSMPPWPAAAAAPFLRHRLRSAGIGDLLSDVAIERIAAEAHGNPGRMLDLAQRTLWPDGMPGWVEPPTEVLPVETQGSILIDLEPVGSLAEAPATVLFAEPPPVVAPAPPLATGMLTRLPVGPRRLLQLTLPVGLVVAAGLLIWAFDQPPPAPKPEQVAVIGAPPPEPLAWAEPVAPPPVPPPAAAAPPVEPPIPAEDLIARGDALLAGGDFAAARLFYLQAARAGNAKAATSVARTYDPLALARLGVVGGHGDPGKAAEWYRKAVDLGDPAAAEPLRRLVPP
ncbi:MAG: hypothetical protein JWO51_202 [Rhodospirillales bacterium]|nr:hypothetical protein [Rhodospirillales bacterium]